MRASVHAITKVILTILKICRHRFCTEAPKPIQRQGSHGALLKNAFEAIVDMRYHLCLFKRQQDIDPTLDSA